MKAALLSIGDELLGGRCLDTDAFWMAGRLAALGIEVVEKRTVPDAQAVIVAAMRSLLASNVEVLLVTGGLGPTPDDLTREALAELLDDPLIDDEQVRDWVESTLRASHLPNHAAQARLWSRPASTRAHRNHVGTAPTLQAPGPGGRGTIWLLPGPPAELRDAWTRAVLPWLQSQLDATPVIGVTVSAFGLIEADFVERLGELVDRDRRPRLGTRVSQDVFQVHIDPAGCEGDAVESLAQAVCARLHPWVLGDGHHTLAAALAEALRLNSMSLATAESCTGGALAAMIVDQAGASRWYRGGWVVYTNDMKQSCLGVEGSVLTTHGAVSAEAVEAMAQAAALRSGADYAVAVSGIAGPDGGTKDKPVGTIWIAAHGPEGTLARAFRMGQDRGRIRARSSQMALQLVRWLGSGHGNTPTSWDAP